MSYMDSSNWEECSRCGQCLVKCPVIDIDRKDAKKEIGDLIQGKKAKRIYEECGLCLNCNSYCPKGMRPLELITERILNKRKGGLSNLLSYMITGNPHGNYFADLYSNMEPVEKKILDKWSKIPPKSKEILFLGCSPRLACYDIEHSEVLKELPKYGPRDLCCGEMPYRLISWQCFSDVVEKFLAQFQKLDIETMVCYCGSCYYFMSNVLPNVYKKKLPFKVKSMFHWIWEKVEKGELKVKNPLNFKTAISEACYISGLGKDYAQMMRNLYKAAGAEIVELDHHGDTNLCCGYLNMARSMNPAKTIMRGQNRKLKDLKKSGAKGMAFTCPGCYVGFRLRIPPKKHMHYMPEEILHAFGDEMLRPISSTIKLTIRSVLKNLPHVVRALIHKEMPRIPNDSLKKS